MNTEQHAAGPEPSRASGNVTLTWGYITLPLAVWAGESDGIKVERHEYVAGDHPVGRASIDKVTDKLVDTGSVVKKATASDGTIVEVSDDEMEQASTSGFRGGASEILTFIPLEAIGPVYQPTAANQLRPAKLVVNKKKVDNPGANKAFALLLQLMGEAKVAALFKVKLRGPARYAALTPDGRMVTLAFAEQVRPAMALPEAEFTDGELQTGRQFFADTGITTPVLADTVSAEVQAYVDAKAAGVEPTEAVEERPLAPVVDLFAALEASVAAARATKEPAVLVNDFEPSDHGEASPWPQAPTAA